MASGDDSKDLSKQFIKCLDKSEKVPAASSTYNITAKSAAHVIAIFKLMVNNRMGQYEYTRDKGDKVFTFIICHEVQAISFQVKANPYADQPGNGFIGRKDPRSGGRIINYSYNNDLVDKLKQQYSNDTKKFAQDIKRVFKNNSELFNCGNEIIKDVYFLLLFEIGRRLVKDDPDSTPRKKKLDNLRISEAITKIVKLFENEACRFEDVFLKVGAYHCFSGDRPETRQGAITLLLTQLEELKLEDLKELFHVEEPVSEISEVLQGLRLSE